jgi:hypothetical protein
LRACRRENKKGEILSDLSLLQNCFKEKAYFFFLAGFLATFLAGFFLVAMENHPLIRSHFLREIVKIKFTHLLRIKISLAMRQM